MTRSNLAHKMTEDSDDRQATQGLASILSRDIPFLNDMARRICRDETDAKDLVQDTCERALLQWTSALPPDKPRAWFVTIMHNLFVDRCRRRARRPIHLTLNDDTPLTAVEEEPEPQWSTLTLVDIVAALDDIEPPLRRVYQMHVLEHRSYVEIAEALHIERLTVGTRLHRARKRLREVLLNRSARGFAP